VRLGLAQDQTKKAFQKIHRQTKAFWPLSMFRKTRHLKAASLDFLKLAIAQISRIYATLRNVDLTNNQIGLADHWLWLLKRWVKLKRIAVPPGRNPIC